MMKDKKIDKIFNFKSIFVENKKLILYYYFYLKLKRLYLQNNHYYIAISILILGHGL